MAPELSRAVSTEGHEILNHSCEHKYPSTLTGIELRQENVGARMVFSYILRDPTSLVLTKD